MASAELLELANYTGPPIDDGPEHVEGQGSHTHGSSTTFPSTPPSARLCNAALPSDNGYLIGGGGRSPALTSSATPNSNNAWAPGVRLTNSPYPTPITLTLRSSSRLTLTVGMPPAANPMTSSRPSVASARIASSKASPPIGSTTRSTPRPPVCSFTASSQPSTRAAPRQRPGTRRTPSHADGAPSRSPWHPVPLRSEWRPCRHRRPSRTPAPFRR